MYLLGFTLPELGGFDGLPCSQFGQHNANDVHNEREVNLSSVTDIDTLYGREVLSWACLSVCLSASTSQKEMFELHKIVGAWRNVDMQKELSVEKDIADLLQDRRLAYLRYDTRCYFLTCARKPTRVSLIYRTEPTTKKCKTEKLKSKNGCAQK